MPIKFAALLIVLAACIETGENVERRPNADLHPKATGGTRPGNRTFAVASMLFCAPALCSHPGTVKYFFTWNVQSKSSHT